MDAWNNCRRYKKKKIKERNKEEQTMRIKNKKHLDHERYKYFLMNLYIYIFNEYNEYN